MRGYMTLRDDFLAPAFWANNVANREILESRGMPVDIVETAGTYELHAELPGFAKQEIAVEIDGNVVSLSAAKAKDVAKEDGERTVLRSERYTGKLERRFKLANEVDEANATAKFENGILVLTLPKKAVETRRITIQ